MWYNFNEIRHFYHPEISVIIKLQSKHSHDGIICNIITDFLSAVAK